MFALEAQVPQFDSLTHVKKPDIVVCACDPSIGEAETGEALETHWLDR